VVTGDLVQGAPLGQVGYRDLLDDQYAVAADFLELLAEHFLDGDRSRLVMVPGNHDIDWNCARSAMEPVAETEVPESFTLRLCNAASDLRWSWRERRVYRIVDRELYDQRLARFNALTEEFYAGCGIVKQPAYCIHRLCGGRIAMVAFDSCLGNDCFALQGKIDEQAIADAFIELRKSPPDLSIAVWHHSIEGEPIDTAYMSPSTVEDLIGKGFRLGLHGHQHRAAADNRYVHLPDKQEMAIVSAGSLCAAGWSLPTGVARQYNLIEISDGLTSARVHVREVAMANNFGPARRTEFGLKGYIDLDWQLPPFTSRYRAEASDARILEAERAKAKGEFAEVEQLLADVFAGPGTYARNLLRLALEEQKAWGRLISLLDPPATISEVSIVTRALAENGDSDAAEEFLQKHHECVDMTAPDVENLRAYISAKKALA